MQVLSGFKRRYKKMDRGTFLRKVPGPFLVLRMPGLEGAPVVWVCPVRNRPDEAHFREEITIGRADDNDIVLENDSVSKQHAQILHREEQYLLTDLNSKNGTTVNTYPMQPFVSVPLRSGERLGFGLEVRAIFITSEDFHDRIFVQSEDPFQAHGPE